MKITFVFGLSGFYPILLISPSIYMLAQHILSPKASY